jgi:hypothetical protein
MLATCALLASLLAVPICGPPIWAAESVQSLVSDPAPVYLRRRPQVAPESRYPAKTIAVRMHGDAAMAGHSGGWSPRHGGRLSYPFLPYPRMQVFGSWYQRPYPTHLDYFRLRNRGFAAGVPYRVESYEMMPPEELPLESGVLQSR